jgi:acyl carrier protein
MRGETEMPTNANRARPRERKVSRRRVSGLACLLAVALAGGASAQGVSIAERVKKMIVERLSVEPNKVTPTAKFADLADSLALAEFGLHLEEEFGTEIPCGTKAEWFITVGDAIRYLEQHAKA